MLHLPTGSGVLCSLVKILRVVSYSQYFRFGLSRRGIRRGITLRESSPSRLFDSVLTRCRGRRNESSHSHSIGLSLLRREQRCSKTLSLERARSESVYIGLLTEWSTDMGEGVEYAPESTAMGLGQESTDMGLEQESTDIGLKQESTDIGLGEESVS